MKPIERNPVTGQKPLAKFEFRCVGCRKIEKMSGYAIAQIAMSQAISYKCDCGAETPLSRRYFQENPG